MSTKLSNDQKLAAFEVVGACETFDELILALRQIALMSDGIILGRNKNYTIEKILLNLEVIRKTKANYNIVTREYGIRQQCMYLHHYGEE